MSLRGSGDDQVDRLFQQALGSIDTDIRRVFVDLGRFNVIGLPQRLSDNDVGAFIDSVKAYNESTTEIPEGVRLGQVAFTEADFNRLVGAFYVVIPSVTSYSQIIDENAIYETSISTSFTIVDVSNYQTLAAFTIETSGTSEVAAESMRGAVSSVPGQLDFRIRSIEEFQIRTGIIDIVGRDIYLEFGRNMGIQLGEEFRVVRFAERAGYQSEVPIGLLVVRAVDEQYSVATLRFSSDRLVVGDQLTEIPRMGLTLEPNTSFLISEISGSSNAGLMTLGARATVSRGVYSIRPTLGIDLLLGGDLADATVEDLVYFNAYVGAEFNAFLGRLRPNVVLGVGPTMSTTFDENADPTVPFVHVHAKGRLAVLLGESFELIPEVGFSYYMNVSGGLSSFGGITAGLSVGFR